MIPIAHLSLGAVMLESQASWIGYFFDRADAIFTGKHVGEDKFFWASDYPHPDHPGAYLEELRGMVAPMTESGRRSILGENVARAYRLARPRVQGPSPPSRSGGTYGAQRRNDLVG